MCLFNNCNNLRNSCCGCGSNRSGCPCAYSASGSCWGGYTTASSGCGYCGANYSRGGCNNCSNRCDTCAFCNSDNCGCNNGCASSINTGGCGCGNSGSNWNNSGCYNRCACNNALIMAALAANRARCICGGYGCPCNAAGTTSSYSNCCN